MNELPIAYNIRENYIETKAAEFQEKFKQAVEDREGCSLMHDTILPRMRVSTAVISRPGIYSFDKSFSEGDTSFIETWLFSKYTWQDNIHIIHGRDYKRAVKIHCYLTHNMMARVEKTLIQHAVLRGSGVFMYLDQIDSKYCLCGDGTMMGTYNGTCPRCKLKKALEDVLK